MLANELLRLVMEMVLIKVKEGPNFILFLSKRRSKSIIQPINRVIQNIVISVCICLCDFVSVLLTSHIYNPSELGKNKIIYNPLI